MAVYIGIGQLEGFGGRAVVTIGTFDGVHLGHKAILNEVVKHAQNAGAESLLLTFEPHPRKVLFPDQPLGIITPLPTKLRLITETGIQHIVVTPFTRAFAGMTAAEYIRDVLVGPLRPHTIIIGYDHRFGHDRSGNIELLRAYAPVYGYEVLEIPAQLIQDAAVSSTKIRRAIAAGHIEDANTMLGRPYTLAGTVVHGKKLGRTLGYPTANIVPVHAGQIVPGIGIYAVRVQHGQLSYGGMMSIGYNPTVTDDRAIKAEVNIFNFDGDIYDEELTISFIRRLRHEQKFASLNELVAQLHADKEAALLVLGQSNQ